MKPLSFRSIFGRCARWGCAGLAIACVGCEAQSARESHSAQSALARSGELAPVELAPWRMELLDFASDAAAAIPSDPHIKDRSRCQEAVVGACLRLDRADLGERYAKRIDNWRRGSAFADLAIHHARRGDSDAARRLVGLANESSDSGQEWRNERVNAKLATVTELVGQAAASPAAPDDEAVRTQLAELPAVVARGDFDEIKGSLERCVTLYRAAYSNPEHRTLIESAVTGSWSKVPLVVRIDLLNALATAAIEHRDFATAGAFVDQAHSLVAGAAWLPENRVPVLAGLAVMRFRAGDAERGVREADVALASYAESREQILNFDRADALRPLGEAYQEMGATAKALDVYRRAIVDGAENPNARPRAEDLSATCASMALVGVEPDLELWARIKAIFGGLVDPW